MTARVKQVVLSVMHGSFETGFPVMLEIKSNANLNPITRLTGHLPPAPSLLVLFEEWQSAYHRLVSSNFRLEPEAIQVTNVFDEEIGARLAIEYNSWLRSDSKEWQKIKNGIQDNLAQSDEVIVIIEADNIQVQQLPWHLWDLFLNTYSKSEIILSISEF